MNTNDRKAFKRECKIINLAIEYTDYVGDVQYAIVTDLTEDELNTRYEAEIDDYRPFIILSREMGVAMRLFQRNEEKYKKRCSRGERFITCESEDEAMIDALSIEDNQTVREKEEEEQAKREKILEISTKAIASLTPKQKEYLISHYCENMSFKSIADKRGISLHNVAKTCYRGREKYIREFKVKEKAS